MSRLQFYDIAGAHRPPRIALVIERFDARRGGAESYTRDLAVWLAAAERIRVVYNGVDTQRFSPQRHRDAGELIRRRHGIGSNEVLVIAVANNHRLKGIHVLARAIRQLRSAGVPIKALVCGGACPGRADRDKGMIYAGHVTDTAAHYAAEHPAGMLAPLGNWSVSAARRASSQVDG